MDLALSDPESMEELEKILAYYSEELKPLEAPCWAGWKELCISTMQTAKRLCVMENRFP